MKRPFLAAALLAVAVTAQPAWSAGGAAPCPVKVSPTQGAAPLRVTFRATCASSAYRWLLGDGATAAGRTTTYTFPGGRYAPTLRTDDGLTRLPAVTSVALTVIAPAKADYGETVTLRAKVAPKLPVRLGGKIFRDGKLELTVTQPLVTAVAGSVAVRRTIVVKPRLDVRLDGARTLGAALRVVAVLRPAHAGSVQVRVNGVPTSIVSTRSLGAARVVVTTKPKPKWAGVFRIVQAHIGAPRLARGSTGPGVAALEQRLRKLHYAIRDAGDVFDDDLHEAVLAFQKVHGLERTGEVTPEVWSLLARAGLPRARYPGNHIEVDKARQLLFLVRDGKVALTAHVSTGATGNTPLGHWRVYRKVVGWSWVLWYPSYFLRGFAIHGYPSVPPYPASHGCVRVPMWLAPRLFEQIPMGGSIYVYA